MGNITLLELHVPDGDIQLGPKSLRGSKTDAPTSSEQSTEPTEDTEGGRSLATLLLVVGILAALTLIATKLLGEDADEEIAGFDDET